MSDELIKRAAELLLNGATLLSQPCPYCQGVRVMKNGNALCTCCGREPKDRSIQDNMEPQTDDALREQLVVLSNDLKSETDAKKRQDIMSAINSIVLVLQNTDKS